MNMYFYWTTIVFYSTSIHLLVIVGKQPPNLLAVFFGNSIKLMFLHLRMVTNNLWGNLKKSWIHTDSVISTHLLRIHTSHAATLDTTITKTIVMEIT